VDQRQIETTVTVNDKEYKITKTDARTACWLFSFLSAKSVNGQILKALGLCSLEEFINLQNIVLKQTYSLESKDGNIFPTAVLDPRNGSLVDPDLRSDSASVMRLTSEAIFFNLKPFLVENE
jgi:hypothetical protein